MYAGVDNRLLFQRILKVFARDGDIGKHGDVRQPAVPRPRLPAAVRFLFQTADVLALFKVQAVLEPVAPDAHVHIRGGVLRRARAQAVEASEYS